MATRAADTTLGTTMRPGPAAAAGGLRRAVGSFFLFTGGIHLGMVAADPEVYRNFAEAALVPLVRDLWAEVFMANPLVWGLAVMAGELVIGLLLLSGGEAARLGWAGAIGFHVALMLFGWGFWLWCVPALAFLVLAARRDLPTVRTPAARSARPA